MTIQSMTPHSVERIVRMVSRTVSNGACVAMNGRRSGTLADIWPASLRASAIAPSMVMNPRLRIVEVDRMQATDVLMIAKARLRI